MRKGGKGKSASGSSGASPPAEERRVQLSNLDKVFWPEEGYTKGDLIAYYVAVKDWILPYLKDRPLVLTRYPDGIEGKSFYQKNAPDFIPSWVRTESIWSGSSEREIRYLVCDDEDMLVYIINSGAIPLHLWSSRVTSIQKPDWCILDLDPKGAPFKHVVILAKAIKKLCDQIGLPTFVKTSGSTGLHVLIPLGGLCTYEQSRTLGHLIARYIAAEHGEIATIARTLAARRGKVYLDFLQNRHGQLLVSPYCVRPVPGAPVSAPLEWGEVNGRLDPQKFNLKNMLPRLKRKKKDPVVPVLSGRPNLVEALGKLGELTG
jgi:bifunctional non-homologous end joining protein LigD